MRQELAAVVGTLGLSLVESKISKKGSNARVLAVVYTPAGTGIDQCASAHRAIMPILDRVFGPDSYDLEVSSPGIDREFANASEYALFVGKGVQLIMENDEVQAGIIKEASATHLVLQCGADTQSIPLDHIRKGKLDSSQEGR